MHEINDLLRDKECAEIEINKILNSFYGKYKEDIKNSIVDINFNKYKEDFEREYNISIKTEITILL